jgi:hypothetical protein
VHDRRDDDINRQKHNTTFTGGTQGATKPESVQGDLQHLPSALAPLIALPHWVLWRWEKTKDGKWTKSLISPTVGKRKIMIPKHGAAIAM